MLINTGVLFDIGRNNWFKLLLVIFILFLLLRKDLSFKIQFNQAPVHSSPIHKEEPDNVASEKLILSERERSVVLSERLGFSPFLKNNNSSSEVQFWAISKDKHEAFIKRFSKVAKAEADKFDIPSAIILANGLLLSGAGTCDIAVKGNNFFAIPCTADWQGETQEVDGVCYRIYDRAWTSFRDHSFYLTTNIGIGEALPGRDDCEGWAQLLESVGFVSNKESILRIIQEYSLEN